MDAIQTRRNFAAPRGRVSARRWCAIAAMTLLVLAASRNEAQEAQSLAVSKAPPPLAPSPPGVSEISSSPAADEQRSTSPMEASSPTLRLREGTHLKDRLGHFRQNGESVSFVDEENRELGGLPNLSLERIIRMLKSVDEPESITWSVSGTITEFSGRNYLLISRAVYKAATLPPAPDSIE